MMFDGREIIIGLLVVFVLSLLMTVLIQVDNMSKFKDDAIKCGAAEINQTSGDWQWKVRK
jgi:hypothetical protein